MNKREIKAMLKSYIPFMESVDGFQGQDDAYRSVYIGSYMSLDPCGRYHHMLSPNGVTSQCEAFWERLETVALDLGGWIESGEGDPTDIFFCLPAEESEEEEDN